MLCLAGSLVLRTSHSHDFPMQTHFQSHSPTFKTLHKVFLLMSTVSLTKQLFCLFLCFNCQVISNHCQHSFVPALKSPKTATIMSSIAPIIIPAAVKQTATIIFLHGLGDTGHGWASELAALKPKYAKLICPTAPTSPVTINGGFSMPSWFDIRSLDKNDGNEDEEGIKEASASVQKLIQDEVSAGTPASRIVLGGFSQGGALSLYTGLVGSHLLGGIVSMSGYLPIRSTISWATVHKPPIIQCHGDADTVVLYEVGLGTRKVLTEKANLPNYTFKTYPNMDHSSCEEEMRDVVNFWKNTIPPL